MTCCCQTLLWGLSLLWKVPECEQLKCELDTGLDGFLSSATVYSFVPDFPFGGNAHSFLVVILSLSSFCLLLFFPFFLSSFFLHFLSNGGCDLTSASLFFLNIGKKCNMSPTLCLALCWWGCNNWWHCFECSLHASRFANCFYIWLIHSSQPILQMWKPRYRKLLSKITPL